uniref:Uncharacterized protein n=1 Tax=Tanacetum cinerariifolium TaxID=118510 RepID=A0A699HKK4_TANCI|nr:hypothetical protein [Tanacetum cinerariifolium]
MKDLGDLSYFLGLEVSRSPQAHVLKSHKRTHQSGGADSKGKEPMVDDWHAEAHVLGVNGFDVTWLEA